MVLGKVLSGSARTRPRRKAGKAGDLLSLTDKIPREPPVNGLSRHILAEAPVFHGPVDSGSAPIDGRKKAPVSSRSFNLSLIYHRSFS